MSEEKDFLDDDPFAGNVMPMSFVRDMGIVENKGKKINPKSLVQNKLLTPGQMLKHYKILQRLGQGGMGEVYKALDTRSNYTVAIKRLTKSDIISRKRFAMEYRFLKAVNNPNLIKAYDCFEEIDMFMVLEFVEGQSLQQLINSDADLSILEKIVIAGKIARGIEILNLAGIIHRDIKPENIIVNRQSGQVKVLDLGLGKNLGQSNIVLTLAGKAVGTVAYMSPEQLLGEVTEKTDVFLLGITLYQLFSDTKESPFQGENQARTFFLIETHSPPPLEKILQIRDVREKQIYHEISNIIHKALEKNPQNRWASVGEMVTCLAQIFQKAVLLLTQSQTQNPNNVYVEEIDAKTVMMLENLRNQYQDEEAEKPKKAMKAKRIRKAPEKKELPKKPLFARKAPEKKELPKKPLFALVAFFAIIIPLITSFLGVEEHNRNIEIKLAKVHELLENENLEEANNIFEQILAYDSKNTKAELQINIIKTQIKISAQKKILEGDRHLQEGNFRQAQKKFEEALSTEKNNNKAIVRLENLANITPMPLEIWDKCWRLEEQYFDFASNIWVQLPYSAQQEYLSKYQQWRASKQNIKEESILLKQLNATNPSQKIAAIVALGQLKISQKDIAVTGLIQQLENSDNSIRVYTVNALTNIDPEFSKILPLLDDLKNSNFSTVQEAIRNLQNIGKSAIPYVLFLLQSSNSVIQNHAATILGQIGKTYPDYVLPDLLSLFENSDITVKRYAAKTIMGMGFAAKQAIHQILPLLKNPDLLVKHYLSRALAQIGQQNPNLLVPDLIRSWKISDIQTKQILAQVLGEIGKHHPQNVIPKLKDDKQIDTISMLQILKYIGDKIPHEFEKDIKEWSQSTNSYIKSEAIWLLGVTKGHNAIPDLMEFAKDPNANVRQSVVNALGNIGKQVPDSVILLLEKFTQDPDVNVKKSLAQVLGQISRQIPDRSVLVLKELLQDPNIDVQSITANSLINTGRNAVEALPELLKIFSNPLASARVSYPLGYIGRLKPDAVLPTLRKNLEDPGIQQKAAINALRYLGKAAQETVPQLLELLKSPDSQIVQTVIYTLGQIEETEKTVPAFEKMLQNANVVTKQAIIAALQNLGKQDPKQVTSILVELLYDTEPNIIINAISALGNIGPPAKEAIPHLEKLQTHQNTTIQSNAKITIGKIQK